MVSLRGLVILASGHWVLALVGCGATPGPTTSFLRSVDLVDMTEQMSRSFVQDAAIVNRGSRETPWVISIAKVANHTQQIIPEDEKWLYVGRLRARLAESTVSQEHSLLWVVPPERWPIIAAELGDPEPPEQRIKPTHVLTATFEALTTTSGSGRSDAYLCDYQLVNLETASLVWEDSWEIKRSVSGRTYD